MQRYEANVVYDSVSGMEAEKCSKEWECKRGWEEHEKTQDKAFVKIEKEKNLKEGVFQSG